MRQHLSFLLQPIFLIKFNDPSGLVPDSVGRFPSLSARKCVPSMAALGCPVDNEQLKRGWGMPPSPRNTKYPQCYVRKSQQHFEPNYWPLFSRVWPLALLCRIGLGQVKNCEYGKNHVNIKHRF